MERECALAGLPPHRAPPGRWAGPEGGAPPPAAFPQAPLTLLLKVEQPVQQDQGLHQRGQEQGQAEEGHHPVLLGLLGPEGGQVQLQLGVQPCPLQPPLHVSVGSATDRAQFGLRSRHLPPGPDTPDPMAALLDLCPWHAFLSCPGRERSLAGNGLPVR